MAQVKLVADGVAVDAPSKADAGSLSDSIGRVRAVGADASAKMRTALFARFPWVGWTGESERLSGDPTWVYDPVDGAYHYLQGLPLWSSSLVLVRAGKPIMAIVYEPTFGDLYLAVTGGGAVCNEAPVRVSPKSDLRAAVVGTAIPSPARSGESEADDAMTLLGRMARNVFQVRPMASASLQLAYVAAGRLDAYWEPGWDPVDWLAGALLVCEAGGIVTDLVGRPFGSKGYGILAGGPELHAPMLRQAGTYLGVS